VQLHQDLGRRLDVGGTYVDDHDPARPFELRGASALARLAPGTTLEGEWAATRNLATGLLASQAGGAGRPELRPDDPRTQAQARAERLREPEWGSRGGPHRGGGPADDAARRAHAALRRGALQRRRGGSHAPRRSPGEPGPHAVAGVARRAGHARGRRVEREPA